MITENLRVSIPLDLDPSWASDQRSMPGATAKWQSSLGRHRNKQAVPDQRAVEVIRKAAVEEKKHFLRNATALGGIGLAVNLLMGEGEWRR